jgi:hypothetical protein
MTVWWRKYCSYVARDAEKAARHESAEEENRQLPSAALKPRELKIDVIARKLFSQQAQLFK